MGHIPENGPYGYHGRWGGASAQAGRGGRGGDATVIGNGYARGGDGGEGGSVTIVYGISRKVVIGLCGMSFFAGWTVCAVLLAVLQ